MIPTDLKEFHGIYHFHCLSLNNKSNVFIQIILVKQCAYNLDPVAESADSSPGKQNHQTTTVFWKMCPSNTKIWKNFFSALECIYFGLEIRLDSFDNFWNG